MRPVCGCVPFFKWIFGWRIADYCWCIDGGLLLLWSGDCFGITAESGGDFRGAGAGLEEVGEEPLAAKRKFVNSDMHLYMPV